MIDWLVDLYQPYVDRLIVVVSPLSLGLAEAHRWPDRLPVDVLVQERPTGMLDAVMLTRDAVRQSDAGQIILTWCDQIAISPATVARLIATFDAHADAAIVMPTCVRAHPYIHFDRDGQGRIVQVSQRREGHAMPAEGESDAGLFSFARAAFLDRLDEYSRSVADGETTGERNLLPFIPWMAGRGSVVTFPCAHEMEAVGVNTPEELRAVERYLTARDAAR